MTTNVHILATCLDEALIDATLLVFKTLRVGFPTAKVIMWGNDLSPAQSDRIRLAALDCGILPLIRTVHDQWIEGLITNSPEPFWIVDTDVVFWDCVESFPVVGVAMAGSLEPAFVEPWTGTHRVERLHTAVMFLDPELIRQQERNWINKWHPKRFPFQPENEFIRQHYVPQGAGKPPLFYDTCSGFYQAVGGMAFSEQQNACFEHLHCGSYSNRIEEKLPGISEAHRAILADVNAAKGLRQRHEQFYKDHTLPTGG